MNAKDIIRDEFDYIDKKGFDEYDIATILCSSIQENEKKFFENSSEWLAFQLSEGVDNEWGTYYGPFLVNIDGTCTPPKEMITKDVLNYWENRIEEVTNPILKARYSGLLVDFKHNCGVKIRTIHIKSIIDIITGNYLKYQTIGVHKIKRALRLAFESKNKSIIDEVKQVMSLYEDMMANNNNIGICGQIFLLMFDNINHFTQQEISEYVNRLEERLNNLTVKDIDEKFNPYIIEDIVVILAQYYNKYNDKVKLQRVLDILFDSYIKVAKHFSAIQKHMHWNRLYTIFTKYQYNEMANHILVELQNSSKNILEEMSTFEMPIEIPQEQFNQYIKEMTSGSKEEVFRKFILEYIPNKEESKEQMLKISKNSPLMALCPTQLYDYKGRPSSIIGNIENDIEGNLALHISQSLNFRAFFIHTIIKENINKGYFSIKSIIEFLHNCPLFEKDRYIIIEKGIDAYFKDDYLIMMHLLIPQIENAIRNIVELSGSTSLKRNRQSFNGFQLMTFDELLRDNAVSNIGGSDDFSYYLRLLFTDQKGWNLRNSICHGLAPISLFNTMTADRVFHSLLCVGSIRTK
ncbi:MAG: DUF4209 domain-containing protein [Bacteroidales bacterium]|nr:DUF4209 domain-containing protein [Bacteroidales bacterium]